MKRNTAATDKRQLKGTSDTKWQENVGNICLIVTQGSEMDLNYNYKRNLQLEKVKC